MKKSLISVVLVLMLAVMAGCGEKSKEGASASPSPSAAGAASTEPSAAAASPTAAPAEAGTKTIKYLDAEYVVPVTAQRIVITGALEAMEDSILLDIHPVGMISFTGKFPALFAPIADQAEGIGEKTEPNFEKILSLKPDVILATTKFDAAVIEKLKQIAVTIPYSHVATNWEANLALLGELSGKSEDAKKLTEQFKADLQTAKGKVESSLADKKVVVVRIRQGEICIYGPALYFNPILYSDLGLTPPAEIAAAKTQETLSIEKLAEMNPDVLYVQFSEDENANATDALDKLKANPIFKSVNAVKNNQMFVNVVDPLAQGGTAYSKTQFLKAFLEHVQN
ncbi:ABC transporter substrate-binding protein [Gorillibacterium timonense]|uniref:ABC transporter substrate-binding protein n=1 Tax=Gorillibacterium timonense TaxID=1689269 RepID=UPI00071D1AE8|nr:ABC transporter substrate-binding protein [Gorillibacterium timonense]